MNQQDPVASLALSLSKAEANRRKAILRRLKDALADRQISSVLAGRRTLVLRSGEGRPPLWAPDESAMVSNPELYIFDAGGACMHIVTTDGQAYWFGGGRAHPVADPTAAARDYAQGVGMRRGRASRPD